MFVKLTKINLLLKIPLKINCLAKGLLVIFILLGSHLSFGQFTELINSNRPGFSQSPYSVGKGVYQFETGLFYQTSKIVPTFTIPQSFGADIFFRTSFFLEKLELNIDASYQRDKVAFKNIFTSHYFTAGLSELTIGAKYLVYQKEYTDKSKEIRSWKRRHAFDWKRLIPAVAVYAGVNTDFLNDVHKTGSIFPKIGVLLQNNITPDFNLITNFYYDKMGTDYAEFSYIITGTFTMSDHWSSFIENQGIYNSYNPYNNIGGGFAYLFNRNIQLDVSSRLNFHEDKTGVYFGLGFSYRIDNHVDDFKEFDAYGNPVEKRKETNYKKKGFFGRIFSIFNFKKKTKINKKVELEIPDKTNKPIRTRPKRVRKKSVTQKASKKAKKKKKGGFLGIFGGKKKDKKKDTKEKKKKDSKKDDKKSNN